MNMITYTVTVFDYCTEWRNESGQYHRLDGPAVEWSNGEKEWWIDGEELTQSEFENRMKPCKGKKICVDGVEYTLN